MQTYMCSLSRDYVNHAFCTKTSEVRCTLICFIRLTFLHTIIQIWQQFLFLSDRVSLIRGLWQVCKCLILCEPLNNITLDNARALQALFYFYFSLPCFPSSERLRSAEALSMLKYAFSSRIHQVTISNELQNRTAKADFSHFALSPAVLLTLRCVQIFLNPLNDKICWATDAEYVIHTQQLTITPLNIFSLNYIVLQI
jgi:hypothetical protein